VADSCATCFFFASQTYVDKAANTRTQNCCRRNAPHVTNDPNQALWPFVQSTDWCGDFSTSYPGSLIEGFATGDWKWRPTSELLTGWVRANGLTIGSAGSVATERASADCQNLFIYLWNNFTNTQCPVPGGRGASATADYAANKTITLLDMKFRGPFGLTDMGGSSSGRDTGTLFSSGNATTPGSVGGEGAHRLVIGEIPSHVHPNTSSGVPIDVQSGVGGGGYPAGSDNAGQTGSTGGDGTHNNMPPFMLGTWYMKL
jgi:hypothetical protein